MSSMVFLSPISLAGTYALSSVTTTTLVGALSANVIKDFFTNIFLNPSDNMIAVIIVCAVPIALIVGAAFLIKMLFNKYVAKADSSTDIVSSS